MARKKGGGKKVETLRHKDKRKNIPTTELRDFVSEDERQPEAVKYPGLLYARDPSLDPQLVWKGKDEQDREELSVPSVPIYIQEKIHPRVIIEDLKKRSKVGAPEELDLYADFNGISFEDQVDFYHHEQKWSNRMILGDSLLAMTSLAEKEGLKGKVQMIYIDPPYGIKFGSNWQVSTRKRNVKDQANDATRQPEQIRAFRDTWKLGIHSYLSYLRDRLVVSRELLTETGSVFVQIGDENMHLVRNLLDEIFGAENFFSLITFKKTLPLGASGLPAISDYLLWYVKDRSVAKFRQLFEHKPVGTGTGYTWVELSDGARRKFTSEEKESPEKIPESSKLFFASALASSGYTATCTFDFKFDGHLFKALHKSWRTNPNGMERLISANRLIAPGKLPCFITYHNDFPVQPLHNLWNDTHGATDMRYVVETSQKVIERCLLMATDPGDLVLDPTCGSGTTAYVAEQWGRRWITTDTSRVALSLARTRLMSAKYPYYLLADSAEGLKKETEINGKTPPDYKTEGDIKKGFVYKKVPHITLKSIANNPEIDAIHERWQEKLEPIRAQLNKLLTQKWEEWEVPREPEDEWSEEAKALLSKWWEERIARQKEMDAAIARGGEQEILYDKPYEDKKRVRVTGPFTVESLSPHRVLANDEERPATETEGKKESATAQFETMILENLKKAGVQNTVKNERLKFDRLEPFAGAWIHAEGEYTEDGKSRRAAVTIGPEHGTVGTALIKEAAKEAVQGVGFDLLIVCGFAFDPHVSEESKRYGNLKVLTAKMNPDLAMSDEFLKKTGTGNLFMVFGEPDVQITKVDDGKLTAEIKGVDVYDPTTGEIRNSSTDDIACWFIDTDYNGESFFVRHAYFTGAGNPYDKLKRALRTEINEEAWSTLYSTISRPFDPPESGKIAIKVINHYGDEVLKVFEV